MTSPLVILHVSAGNVGCVLVSHVAPLALLPGKILRWLSLRHQFVISTLPGIHLPWEAEQQVICGMCPLHVSLFALLLGSILGWLLLHHQPVTNTLPGMHLPGEAE